MPRNQRKSIRSLVIIVAVIAISSSCVINFYLVAHLDSIVSASASNYLVSPSPSTGIKERTKKTKHDRQAIISPTLNSTSEHKNIADIFREAGVKLDEESIKRLPTWDQIESVIGPKPVMLGLERCQDYRDSVPPLRRMLGSAGMFNSGTNLVTRLIKENCRIPERFVEYGPYASKDQWGILWQSPWGKHTPVKFKYNHTAPLSENITKDDFLPIVTVRNPFDWMKSMCKIPYTTRWGLDAEGKNSKICPNLVETSGGKKEPQTLIVKLADQWLYFDSLAHLWNEWYAQYWVDFTFPFLMVRLEDLVFRQYETTKILCNCAGGVVPPKKLFEYIVNSAKQGKGHGKEEDRTGMVDAWLKFGKPPDVKAGFSDQDWEASLEFLSHELMEKLNYKFPPSE